MPYAANAVPGGGGDLDAVLYEAYEAQMLPWQVGSGSSSSPQVARFERIGGIDASANIGQSSFWRADGTGGVANRYPVATQVQGGNTYTDPLFPAGYVLYHDQAPIPLTWDPSQVVGGLDALPFAYQLDIEVLMRKAGTNVGSGVWFFGFENQNSGSMFSASQGSLGFGVFCSSTATTATLLYARVDATTGVAGINLPMDTPIDVTSAPVLLRWRVTWGKSWAATLYANDVAVASVARSDLNFVNLNQMTGTTQFTGYPKIYTGTNDIAGPYYSHARLALVTP